MRTGDFRPNSIQLTHIVLHIIRHFHTEAGLGDASPKTFVATQKTSEDRQRTYSGRPVTAGCFVGPILDHERLPSTAERPTRGPFAVHLSAHRTKLRPERVSMIRPRDIDGAETHGAVMFATSDITVNAARSRRRRRSRETSMSRASRSAGSYRTSRPPPRSSGSARGAEGPASTVAELSFGQPLRPPLDIFDHKKL